MRRFLIFTALALSSPAIAQEATTQIETAPPPMADQGDMAAANAALDRMSAALRAMDSFEVVANSTMEEVFADGEKLQFLNLVRYVVEKPGNFYASVRSDRAFRRFYYNGEVLTVVAPTVGYYASFPFEGTVSEMLDEVYEKFGIATPLQDLFLWGAEGVERPVLTDAFLVGYAQVGDFPTDQWFFRTEGIDFQIWIGRESNLPHRFVITNTEDPAQPQYVADLTWTESPEIESDRFVFTPGENFEPIALLAEAWAEGDEQ